MHMGMGVGLLLAQRASLGLPFVIGFAQSKSTSPTMPAHQAGDLIIGARSRVGSAASTPSDENWTTWATYTGTATAVSIQWKIAASSSEGWGTWSQTGGRRLVWVFRNAALGHIAGDALDTGEATTTLTWPPLNGGAAFTGGASLVAGHFLTVNPQTSVTGHEPTGLANIRFADPNTATGNDGEVCADTGTSLLTSYAGETKTLDASSPYANFIFSVCRA